MLLLRCLPAALLLAMAAAFTPGGPRPTPTMAASRRQMLETVALGTAAALWLPISPVIAASTPADDPELLEALNRILRVLEATAQEERLIKSGKFKDLQRANVKIAVDMMLRNYKLQDNLNSAAAFVPTSSVAAAGEKGRAAVEYLTQVLDYFDTGKQTLQVGDMSSDKRDFALRALSATRTQLQGFLEFLPADAVAAAQAVIDEENRLNVKEYDGDLANMPKLS